MNNNACSDDLTITLGVEEEFFLIDPESMALVADPDPALFETCAARQGEHKVVHEFLRSQIETNSRVCASVNEVRTALRETRKLLMAACEQHNIAAVAMSTHPFAAWEAQMPTPKDRYENFAITFQESVRRVVAGGLHIHAGFGDDELRVKVMTALRRYLPMLNALSSSSPFSGGRESGFKSSRLNLLGALPRSSIPGPLYSRQEFDLLVQDYQRMEFIGDGSELWWDIRPSHTYPTVELRICDVCTRMEDTMTIVALYASLARWLLRQALQNSLPPEPQTEIILENRWLAQRYGVLAFLGDTRRGGRIDIADEVAWLVAELEEDAQALGCAHELRHARHIVENGSGADRQIDHFRLCLLDGASKEEALRSVVKEALAETVSLGQD